VTKALPPSTGFLCVSGRCVFDYEILSCVRPNKIWRQVAGQTQPPPEILNHNVGRTGCVYRKPYPSC
jgi:hypothetical protein